MAGYVLGRINLQPGVGGKLLGGQLDAECEGGIRDVRQPHDTARLVMLSLETDYLVIILPRESDMRTNVTLNLR